MVSVPGPSSRQVSVTAQVGVLLCASLTLKLWGFRALFQLLLKSVLSAAVCSRVPLVPGPGISDSRE